MAKKVVLVTGASRGIGHAIAERFAQQGYCLAINCKNSGEALISYADKLARTYHIPCLPLVGDVSQEPFAIEAFHTIGQKFGGIDILVNNAGISKIGLLSDMSLGEWNQILQVNLTSLFCCCKHAIPYMLRSHSGSILNISSVWGNAGASCEVAYSASKGGVNAFTKALAKELAPSNIQVNAAAFGLIDTDMNQHFSAEELDALKEEIPADRAGTCEEAAALLLQLAHSPDYLTGQIITMDGGWT